MTVAMFDYVPWGTVQRAGVLRTEQVNGGGRKVRLAGSVKVPSRIKTAGTMECSARRSCCKDGREPCMQQAASCGVPARCPPRKRMRCLRSELDWYNGAVRQRLAR